MTGRAGIDEGLAALRGVVEDGEARDEGVSAWSVGMHVEHCCLAMTGIGRALVESSGPPPRRFRWMRWVILTLGWIPRGRARAPDVARPSEGADAEALAGMLDEAEDVLQAAAVRGPDAWFEHFALGVMDRDQSLDFLAVHNRHHQKIIRDILSKAGRP